jgi:cob(I)alamin adenosyltransferase
MNQGLVYVFTGGGKGKTSAAVGTAIRAAGAGMRVGWVAFYKQESWKLSELDPLKRWGVQVYLMGKGFHLQNQAKSVKVGIDSRVIDTATEAEHKQAAEEALMQAGKLIKDMDLLVLDEVNNAVDDHLIDLSDLTDLISKRKQTHLVLTGRDAKPEIVKIADLVTDMKKIKHPYDKGKLAVKGLDY